MLQLLKTSASYISFLLANRRWRTINHASIIFIH